MLLRDDAPRPGAVVFDFDETVLDRRPAWRYALEQAASSVAGRRVDASGLVEEYHRRPVAHAVAVLMDGAEERAQCQALWREMFYRSAMKRLLLHEGVAMGLDRLVSAKVEVGLVSREPHSAARKQVDSTGLDRFVAVLSASPEVGRWDVAARLAECAAFVEKAAGDCVFVSAEADDLRAAERAGWVAYEAGWVAPATEGRARLDSALEACPVLLAAWARRGSTGPRRNGA